MVYYYASFGIARVKNAADGKEVFVPFHLEVILEVIWKNVEIAIIRLYALKQQQMALTILQVLGGSCGGMMITITQYKDGLLERRYLKQDLQKIYGRRYDINR